MDTQTPDINAEVRALIEGSVLLTEERRLELMTVFPSLDRAAMEELRAVLRREDDVLNDVAQRAIEKAVRNGDKAFLERIDALLNAALRTTHEEEERRSRNEEDEATSHLLDIS